MKAVLTRSFVATLLLALLLAAPLAAAREKPKALYPDATREAPELDLRSQRVAEKLNDGLAAVNEGDAAKAKSILEPLSQDDDSKYAQAMALKGLANLAYQAGDKADAIAKMKQALEIGVMPNDTYYQLMYTLVQFYVADQQYDQAGSLLKRWQDEGKREMAAAYALQGNIAYREKRYEDAVSAITKARAMNEAAGEAIPDSWDQLLAASYAQTGNTDNAVTLAKQQLAENPDDPDALHNAISLLVQAQRFPEALELLQQAESKNLLSTGTDYLNMAKIYLMIAQGSDDPAPQATKSWQILEKGIAKGVVKPDYDIYKLQGDAAYTGGNLEKAVEFYKKAEPLGSDGQMAVRQGQILASLGKYGPAIKQLKAGIAKGVPHPGRAYITLGAAYNNASQRGEAVRAMLKAAEYPETSERAKRWLRKAGVATD